jgi:hypothetical protein
MFFTSGLPSVQGKIQELFGLPIQVCDFGRRELARLPNAPVVGHVRDLGATFRYRAPGEAVRSQVFALDVVTYHFRTLTEGRTPASCGFSGSRPTQFDFVHFISSIGVFVGRRVYHYPGCRRRQTDLVIIFDYFAA